MRCLMMSDYSKMGHHVVESGDLFEWRDHITELEDDLDVSQQTRFVFPIGSKRNIEITGDGAVGIRANLWSFSNDCWVKYE